MLICDSQIHLWAADTPERPWPEGSAEAFKNNAHRNEPMGADEMIRLMDGAGVDRAIIVPPGWEGNRVDVSLAAASAHPGRFAIMPWIPLDRPDDGRAMLESWKDEAAIRGIRFTFFTEEQRAWITDGTAEWYWEYAEANNIPTAFFLLQNKELIAEVAIKHPGLKLIMDHVGVGPNVAGDDMNRAIAATSDLAQYPNMAVKVSATPGLSSAEFPYSDITDAVKGVIKAFGPERSFWGTDITRIMQKMTYAQTVTNFTDHLGLSEDELEWIMGRGICEFLDWPIE